METAAKYNTLGLVPQDNLMPTMTPEQQVEMVVLNSLMVFRSS